MRTIAKASAVANRYSLQTYGTATAALIIATFFSLVGFGKEVALTKSEVEVAPPQNTVIYDGDARSIPCIMQTQAEFGTRTDPAEQTNGYLHEKQVTFFWNEPGHTNQLCYVAPLEEMIRVPDFDTDKSIARVSADGSFLVQLSTEREVTKYRILNVVSAFLLLVTTVGFCRRLQNV